MKHTRSLIMLFLSLLLTLTLLVSCTGGKDPADTTPVTTTDVTEPSTDPATDPETDPETVPATETETETEPETETETETEEETPDYFEVNRIDIVEPDPSKFMDMAIANDGYDIYTLTKNAEWGYRYGCTYLYNDDGTIDAYFACVGTISGEWDWISYRHSPDGGKTWGNEKVVLTPTQGSMDHFSNCDPGVVYFNGYYYLGYTSTLNSSGTCNNLFVARSKTPDGPFEKWNGEGWGGPDCRPIVYFDEDWQSWGIGEPSFIELNGTLYMYYTSTSPSGSYCMVATADATNENWPATLQFHGAACKRGGDDSLDVKYIEEWGKFIGVATGSRMNPNSYLSIYESNDGLTFQTVDAVKEGTYQYLHNAGISSRRNGHIRITEDADKLCVIYAYGNGWGIWNTRVQPITLVLGSGNNIAAERAKKNIPDPLNRAPLLSAEERYVAMVRPVKDVYVQPVTKASFVIMIRTYDTYFTGKDLPRTTDKISFSDYDENVVSFNGIKCVPVGVGETAVTLHYEDLAYTFYIRITEKPETAQGDVAVDLVPVRDTYTILYTEKGIFKPQIRAQIIWDDGSFDELYVDAADKAAIQGEKLVFEGYDESIISVNSQGIITAKKVGETDVNIIWNQFTATVHVVVTADSQYGHFSVKDVQELDYTNLDFSQKQTLDAISGTNNCVYSLTGEATRLKVTGGDTFIQLAYSNALEPIDLSKYSGVEITYAVSPDNSAKATTGQLFVITSLDGGPSEAASMKQTLQCDGAQHTLVFNFDGRGFWSGELTSLRWDYFDAASAGDIMDLISVKLIAK